MKSNELMVGDIITHVGRTDPVKVVCIDSVHGYIDYDNGDCTIPISIDFVKPFPITGKLLEDNGFYASDVSPHHIKYVCSTGPIDEFADIYLICGKDNKGKWRWDCLELRIHYYRGDIHQRKINYVHELQHALRLCGIENEIEL